MSNGTGKVITEIYAIVATHGPGDEGIMGAKINGNWMPLVASEKRILVKMLPIAREQAAREHTGIKLIKLSTREEIDLNQLLH